MTISPVDRELTELRIRQAAASCRTLEEARHSGTTFGRLLAAKVKDRKAEVGQPHGAHRIIYEAALTNMSLERNTFVAGVADAALVAFRTALRG